MAAIPPGRSRPGVPFRGSQQAPLININKCCKVMVRTDTAAQAAAMAEDWFLRTVTNGAGVKCYDAPHS